MVGANYTGGRRNAAKARSKDTTGRLQRGHFSKQRLGILTNALGSRGPDHNSLSCPPVADNPNLTARPRSGSLISPSGYPTCMPIATVHDISLGHAKRDLARNHLQPQLRQSIQQDSHLHRNSDIPSPQPQQHRLGLPTVTSVQSPTPLALTGKGEPDPAHNLQTLLPATTSVGQPCATPLSRPEPALHLTSPEKQPTPFTETPSKRRSRILDLIDASDRKHPFPGSLDLPHCLCKTWHPTKLCIVSHTIHSTYFLDHSHLRLTFPTYPHR